MNTTAPIHIALQEFAAAVTDKLTQITHGEPEEQLRAPFENLMGAAAGVLGRDVVRVAIEAACGLGWDRYLGPGGAFVGMTGFGASAPVGDLYEHFGLTAEAVADAARARLAE
jgi:pyruvate dehydrogenase complex dehydrogenase (E1) component